MKTFLITSPQSKMGKTSLLAGLSKVLLDRGEEVRIINSLYSNSDLDILDSDMFSGDIVELGVLDVRRQFDSKSVQKIKNLRDSLNSNSGFCFIESNLNSEKSDLLLSRTLDSKLVLVINYSNRLKSELKVQKEGLFGVIINNVPKYRMISLKNDLIPSLLKDGINVIGAIPEDRCLISCTVNQFLQHIEGKLIYEASTMNSLIENVLIGGMVLDWSVHYFRSSFNVAAIIRGDRPDVQLGALQSGKVKALILTKGIEPIEYVYYEAQTLEIPIILSEKDTETTVNSLETINKKSNFNHPDKLQRISDLISEHCNIELF